MNLDSDIEMEELLLPKKSYWARLVSGVGDFKEQIKVCSVCLLSLYVI